MGFYSVQLGPPGAVERMHVDNFDSHCWYAQIEGLRAFVLVPPEEASHLYEKVVSPEPGSDERGRLSPVDIFRPEGGKHSRFKNARAQVAVVGPGEVLVVPAGWWKWDVMLEPCVTLFHRFWNR